ncbi:fluoroquinolones export ATP-binding protein [Lachnospiraceae bacterium]|nr:fluoroquinolones export ATP-binding protein [Lachnospiraceae bacterium]
MEYAVEMRHIVQRFGEKEVLRGIDLKIHEGEIFGLLGPSGAGKTTLIKILTGQLRQTAGEVQIFGKNAGNGKANLTEMGMMMDNFGLYERLSCYDNLKLFTRIYGVPEKRAGEILGRVGLYEDRKLPVMKLSKGMRSRLSLARAVMNEPRILFLDEPASGLDPATAAEIHKLVQEEQSRGATIFLTTHNMEEAHKLCDHVALLHEGVIVEYGQPGEVCCRYNHQNKLLIRLLNGEMVELSNNRTSAERVKEYLEQEMVETIHSTEPSLETVFMELTGRGLE